MAEQKGATYICYETTENPNYKPRAIVLYYQKGNLVDNLATNIPTLWGYVDDPIDPCQFNGQSVEGQLFECTLGPVGSKEKVFQLRWMISPEATKLSETNICIGKYVGTPCGWAVQSLTPDAIKNINEANRFKPNFQEVKAGTVLRKVHRGDFEWYSGNSKYRICRMYWIFDDPSATNMPIPFKTQIDTLLDKAKAKPEAKSDSWPGSNVNAGDVLDPTPKQTFRRAARSEQLEVKEAFVEDDIVQAPEELSQHVAEELGVPQMSAFDLFDDWGVGIEAAFRNQ